VTSVDGSTPAQYRAGLALQEKLAADFPAVTEYAVDLGGSYCNFGNLVADSGDPTAALEWHSKAIDRLGPVIPAGPKLVRSRAYLRNSHWKRAEDFTKLRRFAEALPDWDKALDLDDGSARDVLRLGRADCLARLGRTGDAVPIVEEMATYKGATVNTLYDCACVFAVASAAPKSAAADRHADRAVKLLRQAADRGYRDVPHLLADPDLEPLRKRADYAALLWDIADMPGR
jgi:tetratricopeptide (TPR) repeat protein